VSVVIHQGDCREVMPTLPSDSVDSVVTDPPYALTTSKRFVPGQAGGFMGKTWDTGDVAFDPATWEAVLRVLRPGGHLLAAGGSRTHHRLAGAIEDAGFEIRDTIVHLFGQGFPKSLDISKAIDKAAGVERPRVPGGAGNGPGTYSGYRSGEAISGEAVRWQGFGTALKPAAEFWVLARKPLSARSVAANVLAHGTGGINVDACRLGGTEAQDYTVTRRKLGATQNRTGGNWRPEKDGIEYHGQTKAGRWPANVVLSHTPECREVGTRKVKVIGATAHQMRHSTQGIAHSDVPHEHPGFRDPDGTETIPAWECSEDCPVRMLDEQSGKERGASGRASGPSLEEPYGRGVAYGARRGTAVPAPFYGDTGGASRFYFTAKAGPAERSEGMAGRSKHPTVKPLALMVWLVKLVTPPGGRVLDPFLGTGTTAIACLGNGFSCIGIEREPEYVEEARQRIGLGCEVATRPLSALGDGTP
jgi:site-specific DNA-methyltransferase (adenine-specific)